MPAQTPLLPLSILRVGLASMILMACDVELPDEAPIPPWRKEELRRKAVPAMPKAEKKCQDELRRLGAEFAAAGPVEAVEGCSLAFPLKVTSLGADIALQPPAIVSCRTARAAARLFQGSAMGAAEKHFGTRISAVQQASGYVCRKINGSANISQHAFGDALDVSAVTLSGDRRIMITRHVDADSPEARFQKAVRDAACGIFTTVLGPGTDADHGDHFHFDLKRRRAPYCR